jgi:streptogramin lyase
MARRLTLAGIAALGALFALAPSASAKPRVNGVFDVSSIGTNNQITVGPDGNVWATLDDATNDVVRVTPQGATTEFDLPDVTFPVGITAGPDGDLWVTQINGVASFPPSNPSAAEDFAIGAIGGARAITVGPDGNLWTASDDQLVRIPPSNPAGFAAFTINNMSARWIASGGGKLWIADFFGVTGGRIISATTGGSPTFFEVGGTGPQGVTTGAKQQVAYTNQGTNPQTVGRIKPGGTAQTTDTPLADPFGITLGSDGAYWFDQFAKSNLGRLTPKGKVTQLGGLPANSGPRQIAAGPKNTLWATLDTSDQIARVKGVDPKAKITKGPKRNVEAEGARTKVKFRFKSPGISGLNFQCAMKKKGDRSKRDRKLAKFRRCKSPKKYRLAPGTYKFLVRAQGIGKPGRPAKRKFEIVG